MLGILNKSCKHTGANLLRDLNITTAFCFFRLTESEPHFSISRSMLELVSKLAFAITLAARFCNFFQSIAKLVTKPISDGATVIEMGLD